MENNNPLVSIIIITYNSAKYVCDTLDSAYSQTYKNIEIIVSDDCSTDDTIDVCKRWKALHDVNGIPITIVSAAKNTGISGNCNRGLIASNGQWVKLIAGDDILASTAIEDYIDYVISHPEVKHLIGRLKSFTGDTCEYEKSTPKTISNYYYRDETTWRMQYNAIRKRFFGSGPTYFCNTEVLKSVGGFDERFPMQEDYPLYIKIIGCGYKMALLDKFTVYYRVHNDSVSHSTNQDAILPTNKVRMAVDYKYQYQMETLGPIWRVFLRYSLWLQKRIIDNGNTKKSIRCRLLKLMYSLTDPFVIYARCTKRIESKYII